MGLGGLGTDHPNNEESNGKEGWKLHGNWD